jgi:hypothetical protein
MCHWSSWPNFIHHKCAFEPTLFSRVLCAPHFLSNGSFNAQLKGTLGGQDYGLWIVSLWGFWGDLWMFCEFVGFFDHFCEFSCWILMLSCRILRLGCRILRLSCRILRLSCRKKIHKNPKNHPKEEHSPSLSISTASPKSHKFQMFPWKIECIIK